MARATWNGVLLAESEDVVIVEGNVYFPESALRREHVAPSEEHTFCPWKGTASYYDVVVNGGRIAGGVWYYPDPMEGRAQVVRDRVAFWRGVEVER
jgi:uncharacterized protein (DUF427 family)